MIAAAPYFFHCLQLQNITDLNYKSTCHLTTRKEKQKEQKAMSNARSVTDKMTVTDIPVSYSVQKLHKIFGLPRSQLLCCLVVVSCIKTSSARKTQEKLHNSTQQSVGLPHIISSLRLAALG